VLDPADDFTALADLLSLSTSSPQAMPRVAGGRDARIGDVGYHFFLVVSFGGVYLLKLALAVAPIMAVWPRPCVRYGFVLGLGACSWRLIRSNFGEGGSGGCFAGGAHAVFIECAIISMSKGVKFDEDDIWTKRTEMVVSQFGEHLVRIRNHFSSLREAEAAQSSTGDLLCRQVGVMAGYN
jgi:hypothetical protein